MNKKIFLTKALSKLNIAEYAVQKNEYEAVASLLYFALFHTMQSVIGNPPQGAWKHVAIAKVFNSNCFQQQVYSRTMLANISRMYHELYEFRKQSDYSDELFSDEIKQKIEQHITLLHEVASCLQQL